ncbi:MAG: DMT family transporter, partial [Jhaorihella sp.]
MNEKRAIDGFGATSLAGFAVLLAFNQVVIKVTGEGFGPVFQAGLRSVGGLAILLIWVRYRGLSLALPRRAALWGVVAGLFFTFEFVFLYMALDQTTVARASILFYTMPVWLALAAHLFLPGERLSGPRILGLALAMGGVVIALADRAPGGAASLSGDIMALGAALGWAGIALTVRMTSLGTARPLVQLFFQLAVSAPILLALAPFFGPLLNDPKPVHWAGLGFQIVAIASLGYLFWFRLMTIYRASTVAAFSLLSPIFAVFFGSAILGERIALSIWLALS